MSKKFKWVLSALAIVVLITFVSILLEGIPSEKIIDEEVELTEELIELTEIKDVNLQIFSEAVLPLRFGSQSEVYEFTLKGDAPYTLRYLTIGIEAFGLQKVHLESPQYWTVYELEKGATDYKNAVGRGEAFKDGELRVRMFSDYERPYLAEKGRTTFILVGTVLKDPNIEEDANLNIFMPESSQVFDWAWLPGHLESSWLGAEDYYGLENLQ
ncbi:hypothetical protein HOD30_04495 [Candidatus Peregrinibacteria bacterium]|jgi:hypothetical protein|nr:hypothetical protein [Candidatus Peregrinibacteria bacterium]MBT4632385.1 hypothetical protein [Candidatus Peregrinibacteria bacterium]MBT5516430.1 hypothetical protein [Candidatus Peregrinibacteria bacterium]MBT5823589.1 hypothetical protein [Candidatus Peregrinibacteria bacterium]